jgi:hypothetical protein
MNRKKTAVVLTIFEPNNMHLKGRKQIAKWLRQQAGYLVKFGEKMGKKMVYRYWYLDSNEDYTNKKGNKNE